jgi:epoxyqueuosine reductase
MKHAILDWAQSRGYEIGWIEAAAAGEVLAEIDTRRREGGFDQAFAHENLSFDAGQSARPAPWKILVVVMPRPAHVTRFLLGGRAIEAVLPPTYERYRPTFDDVRNELAGSALRGSGVETANVPLKLLSARLGLVRYGRNNLTYSPAAGSYLQLLGYLTDADLPEEARRDLQAPALMDECAGCGVCEALCPTSAIGNDRVLLHVERCLTLANETAGPWPSWVPEGAHNCLIGCLACQRVCPANADLPIVDSGVTFTEEETGALLAGDERNRLAWIGIRRKLEILGQPYREAVVGRNLKALLRARSIGVQHPR